jgi:hypothetical protein
MFNEFSGMLEMFAGIPTGAYWLERAPLITEERPT